MASAFLAAAKAMKAQAGADSSSTHQTVTIQS